jgi:glutaminase
MAAVLTGCKNVDARDTSMRDPSLSSAATLQRVVDEAHAKYKDLQDGKNADYIPILATVPSELFGVVIVTKDGKIYEKGDTNYVFAIESTSKPFNAALVMKEQGPEAIRDEIGVEPTGLPFNSKMAIELYEARSVNPLVNAGAIAQVSMVQASWQWYRAIWR